MIEIYPFLIKPIIKIWCACGCEQHIVIFKLQFEEGEEPEYAFDFFGITPVSLGERIKLALTSEKKYSPVGVIIEQHQYVKIFDALEAELGEIPSRDFEFKYIPEDKNYVLAEIGKTDDGSSIRVDSIFNDLNNPVTTSEIDVYPLKPYKPRIATILSPAFQYHDSYIIDRSDLILFAQLMKFYSIKHKNNLEAANGK